MTKRAFNNRVELPTRKMKINLKITSEDTNIDLIAVRSRDMHGLSINQSKLTCDSVNEVDENRVKIFEMWAQRKLNFF